MLRAYSPGWKVLAATLVHSCACGWRRIWLPSNSHKYMKYPVWLRGIFSRGCPVTRGNSSVRQNMQSLSQHQQPSPVTATVIPTTYSSKEMESENSATSLFLLSPGVRESLNCCCFRTSDLEHLHGLHQRKVNRTPPHPIPTKTFPRLPYSPTPPTVRQPTPQSTLDTTGAFLFLIETLC